MKIKRVYVMYFSPTNGTEKYVKMIAEKLVDKYEVINLTNPQNRRKEYSFNEDDLVIFGVPVYGGRIPQLGIFDNVKGNNTKAIFNVTFGNRAFDDALLEEKNILEAKGFIGIGAAAWVSKHTYSQTIGINRPSDIDIKIMNDFVDKINKTLEKELWKEHELKVPGKYPYKKVTNIKFIPKPDKTCTNCKKCISVCPVGAIDENNPSLIDKSKCISCFACIKSCPIKSRKMNGIIYKKTESLLGSLLKKEQESKIFYLV